MGAELQNTAMVEEWVNYVRLLDNQKMGQGPDVWMWSSGDQKSEYKVCVLRRELDQIPVIPKTKDLLWVIWIQRKINCFLWRVVLDRIPTKEALIKRKVSLSSNICVMCNRGIETADHLMITCDFAQQIWIAVSTWIKISLPRYLLSAIGLLEFIGGLRLDGNKKKAVYSIVADVFWSICLARNTAIFNKKGIHLSHLVADIKAVSFLWINSRAAHLDLKWEQWRGFNNRW
ncbi:putative reverse transcriptase zinc-binding domain-containing protein [Helianthus annuus]|nr:putative reverse transcriptase zinc-binding domain-containing protein [Helianthus annuus]KAJ0925126.1 putative reverse transcriptase zinc-binding domain-containing protein [Helianthus annuus]